MINQGLNNYYMLKDLVVVLMIYLNRVANTIFEDDKTRSRRKATYHYLLFYGIENTEKSNYFYNVRCEIKVPMRLVALSFPLH